MCSDNRMVVSLGAIVSCTIIGKISMFLTFLTFLTFYQLTYQQVTDALRNLLTAMWEQTEAEDRAPYEKKEQDDRARYEREMAAWEASKASQTTSSSTSAIKKKKPKVEKTAA